MQARWSAVLGLGAWMVAWVWIEPPLAVALLLLGPLVAAPLVLGLAHPGGPRQPLVGRWRVALCLQVPAALCAVVSYALPAGDRAALWTLPWLLFAAFLALLGVLRAVEHGFRPVAQLAVDAGLAFLLVGAFWLTFSRWGQPFLGFGEPIAFLTAAHFHFAGLVLPVLGGLAGDAQRSRAMRRLGAGIALALILGIPLVAAGITLQEQQGEHLLNLVAVSWITIAALGVVVLQALLALRPGPFAPRLLWGISAAALPVGMALASLFVYGGAGLGSVRLTLDDMVRTHAVVNVFGFALPGLLAWTLAGLAPRSDLQVLLPILGDRVEQGGWERRSLHSSERSTGDIEDQWVADLGSEAPGAPAPNGPFRRAQARLLAFQVFPPTVLRPRLARTPLQEGDTVRAEYRAFPGLRLGFGARVMQTFDGQDGAGWRAGFTYRTLVGHPECGAETFAVEKDAAGRVRLVVAGWSRPGHALSGGMRGFARRRQVRAAQAAIADFARQVRDTVP